MNDNDNKISKNKAIEIGHNFLVHRHQLLRERILKAEGSEELHIDATFELRNIFEDTDVWAINFVIKPARGIIDPDMRDIFVNKTTGEVGFRTA